MTPRRVIMLIMLLGNRGITQQYYPDYYDTEFGDPAYVGDGSYDSTSDSFYPEATDQEFSDGVALSAVDIAVIVFYGLITFVGLIANSVVFFVILAGGEKDKTVTAIYILMLTTADSVFLITLPIFSVQKLHNTWTFSAAVCSICQTVKFLNYYAGIFFLTAMSVDRYIAVTFSARFAQNQIRTKKRTYIVCIMVWIGAFLMSIPVMLYAGTEKVHGVTFCRILFPGYEFVNETELEFSYDYVFGADTDDVRVTYELPLGDGAPSDGGNQSHHFKCEFPSQPRSYKIWVVANFLISFVVPFMIIVAMYAMILLHLRSAEQKFGHATSKRGTRTRKRLNKIVAALIVCFTICWLPHHILTLARIPGFESDASLCIGLEEFFIALAFSNSAFNPILYTFLGKNFIDKFRTSFHNTKVMVKRSASGKLLGLRRPSHSMSDDPSRRYTGVVIFHKSASNSSDEGSHAKRRKSQLSSLEKRSDTHGDAPIVRVRQDEPIHHPLISDNTIRTEVNV